MPDGAYNSSLVGIHRPPEEEIHRRLAAEGLSPREVQRSQDGVEAHEDRRGLLQVAAVAAVGSLPGLARLERATDIPVAAQGTPQLAHAVVGEPGAQGDLRARDRTDRSTGEV